MFRDDNDVKVGVGTIAKAHFMDCSYMIVAVGSNRVALLNLKSFMVNSDTGSTLTVKDTSWLTRSEFITLISHIDCPADAFEFKLYRSTE